MWIWLKWSHEYFCEIENFVYLYIYERNVSNPTLWLNLEKIYRRQIHSHFNPLSHLAASCTNTKALFLPCTSYTKCSHKCIPSLNGCFPHVSNRYPRLTLTEIPWVRRQIPLSRVPAGHNKTIFFYNWFTQFPHPNLPWNRAYYIKLLSITNCLFMMMLTM